MRREANFDNVIAKILTKNDERGKRNDVIVGVRKELNFSNEVTKIPSAWIFLPRSMKCPKEKCSKGKKKNQLWQSSCWNSREGRKEKKDNGNQVAENGMKKKREKEFWLEDSKWCFH